MLHLINALTSTFLLLLSSKPYTSMFCPQRASFKQKVNLQHSQSHQYQFNTETPLCCAPFCLNMEGKILSQGCKMQVYPNRLSQEAEAGQTVPCELLQPCHYPAGDCYLQQFDFLFVNNVFGSLLYLLSPQCTNYFLSFLFQYVVVIPKLPLTTPFFPVFALFFMPFNSSQNFLWYFSVSLSLIATKFHQKMPYFTSSSCSQRMYIFWQHE